MKKTILMGLIVVGIGAMMIASLGTSNLVSATIRKNLAGKEAAELAQCDDAKCVGEDQTNKGAMGQHSSDERSGGEQSSDGGRKGLPNALTEHGDPQHPSEVIGTLCGDDGGNCP